MTGHTKWENVAHKQEAEVAALRAAFKQEAEVAALRAAFLEGYREACTDSVRELNKLKRSGTLVTASTTINEMKDIIKSMFNTAGAKLDALSEFKEDQT